MAKFIGEDYTNKPNQALSAPLAGTFEFLSALNIFLSITAAVGNSLIIIALKNVSSIHPPTKLFFRCLAITDLCVGLILQPLFAIFIMSRITNMNVNVLYYVVKVYVASAFSLVGISALTSTAISVDRLLALLLGLRYRHVVTLRRVRVVITCFWLIGASYGCIIWSRREDLLFKETSVVLILCLITSIFCYTRIHIKLRHQQALVQNNVFHGRQNEEGIPLNIARYKKTVSSIMWVQLALVACYAPWGVVSVLEISGIEHELPYQATETLVYMNSSLNPILYCWKIREVREKQLKVQSGSFIVFRKLPTKIDIK